MTTWCAIHDRQATLFCTVCSRCTCSACSKPCKGHEQVKLLDAADTFKDLIDSADVNELVEKMRAGQVDMNNHMVSLDESYKKLKTFHQQSGELAERRGTELEEEKTLFKQLCDQIQGFRTRTKSNVLKDACEIMLESFDVETGLTMEREDGQHIHNANTKLTSRARSVVYAFKQRVAGVEALIKRSPDVTSLPWEERVALLGVLKFQKSPELKVLRELNVLLKGSNEIMEELGKFIDVARSLAKVIAEFTNSDGYEESSVYEDPGDLIGLFTAFDGADGCAELSSPLLNSLRRISPRVAISQPVWVDRIVTSNVGAWMYATLSNSGVFAVAYENVTTKAQSVSIVQRPAKTKGKQRRPQKGSNQRIVSSWLKIIDLLYDDECNVALPQDYPAPINVVCVDEDVFLLPNKGRLEKAPLRRLLSDSTHAAFHTIEGPPPCNGFCDSSLVPATRTIAYTVFDDQGNQVCEFNIDDSTWKTITVQGQKLYGMASLSGIRNPSVKAVLYSEGDWNGVSAMKRRGSITPVVDSGGWNPLVTLPSRSCPIDPSYFVVVFNGCVGSSDEGVNSIPSDMFGFQYGVSVVRLCMDCFLLFDARVGRWCIIRIAVE